MFSIDSTVRRVAIRGAISALLVSSLTYCSALEKEANNIPVENVANDVLSKDLTARSPAPALARPPEAPSPGSEVYPGQPEEASASDPRPQGAQKLNGDAYNLNFQNADVTAVTKVILGDILDLPYSVDPRIQGTISLSSGRPVAKADMIPLFESALKLLSANLVKEGKIYKVVPIGEALGNGAIDRSNEAKVTPGYGVSVLPLKYISAQAVLRALDSFAVKPGAARVEPSRNLLLVQGSSTERASAIEAAKALDVDWMKNQAVGVFPIRNASPETMISELRNVFDSGNEGSGRNLVRFQAINRLNAVLAVAHNNALIKKVRTWIGRLDRADYNNTTVRVYRVRFGNAKVLAGILREVFTGQPNTANSDLSQLTPGSHVQRATSNGTTSGQQSPQMYQQPGGATGDSPTFFGNNNNGENPTGEPGNGNRHPNGRGRAGIDIAALSNTSGGGNPILPNVRITADVANNSLLIYASRDEYKIIERAIFELDRAPLQVAIDVTVAEITLKNQLQYGVQFFLEDIRNGRQKGSIGFGLSNILSRTIPGANFVLGSNNDPRVVLNALKAITDVRVISSPALVVLDNQTATLQVGDQVPITTQQATDITVPNAPIVNSIQMLDTGVILKVTPRVNANGVVNLDVTQEVSAVQQNNNGGVSDPTQGTTTLTPTISKRKVQSAIAVASGQTVLLAGMISSQDEKDKQGIPFLSDLKNIGDLFATNTKTTNRTELIIFIRPQIIRNGVDAQLVAEELRSKLSVMAREGTLNKVVPRAAHFTPLPK